MNQHARDIFEEVLQERTKNLFLGVSNYPYPGQFLSIDHADAPLEKMIGYCVQIRKGVGYLGSDVYFLRHYDGNIVTHENQGFYALTTKQEDQVRALFIVLPEEEDSHSVYTIQNGQFPETGFMIEKNKLEQLPIHNTTYKK